MAQATYHFPDGFFWGTATAAHQVEGNNTNNNWFAWENQPCRILNGDKSGAACDWWRGRWRDDFDRAKEGGQNAHRLSLEWNRIQPAPDRGNEDALDVYREMLCGLFHWSLVDNFEWERGWSQRFGLWGLDTATQARVRRPSVDLYTAICKANALTLETVSKYAADSVEKLFP